MKMIKKYTVMKDGNMWCCNDEKFEDPQISHQSWGETPCMALHKFILEEERMKIG